jgi:hypothetical protein
LRVALGIFEAVAIDEVVIRLSAVGVLSASKLIHICRYRIVACSPCVYINKNSVFDNVYRESTDVDRDITAAVQMYSWESERQ